MNWNNILSGDCTVYGLGPRMVYPIFRCGFTSIRASADQTFINKQIKTRNIDILIRDPADRFISGVNEYARQNNADVEACGWAFVTNILKRRSAFKTCGQEYPWRPPGTVAPGWGGIFPNALKRDPLISKYVESKTKQQKNIVSNNYH